MILYFIVIILFGFIYQAIYLNNKSSFLFNSEIQKKQEKNYFVSLKSSKNELLDSLKKYKSIFEILNSININIEKYEEFYKSIEKRISKFKRLEFRDTFKIFINKSKSIAFIVFQYQRYNFLRYGLRLYLYTKELGNNEIRYLEFRRFYDIRTFIEPTKFLNNIIHSTKNIINDINIELRNIEEQRIRKEVWNYWDFFYFSLMTMSTTGFGDIIPNNTFIRLMVVLEIFIGIILTIFLINFVIKIYIYKN